MSGLRWAGAFLLILSGCPGDDSGGTGESDTDSSSQTSPSSSAGSMSGGDTESGSASMSGGSMSTEDTGTPSDTESTTNPGTDSDNPTSTTDPTGDTTNGVDECAGLGRKECSNNEACRPIACQPIVADNRGGFCLDANEFIGCISADTACAEVRTTACEGDDATVYVCPDACIPDMWLECPPPGDGDLTPCPDGGG